MAFHKSKKNCEKYSHNGYCYVKDKESADVARDKVACDKVASRQGTATSRQSGPRQINEMFKHIFLSYPKFSFGFNKTGVRLFSAAVAVSTPILFKDGQIRKAKLEIALEPLVGCPVMPSVDWEIFDPIAKYHWFVGNAVPKQAAISFDSSSQCGISIDGFTFVSTFPFYCPTEEDLGKYLALVIQFSDEDIGRMAFSPIRVKRPTENKNDRLIFERRQEQFCKEKLFGNKYRILSYNVLAHLYLKSALKKKEQENQYFPYCPKEFQYDSYRYPLLLKELQGYNADILFLQEVDVRFQKRFLIKFLKIKGYTPIFNCKENQVNEGLIIASRTDRFNNNGNYTAKLSDLLKLPSNSDILEFLKNKPESYKIISTRPSIIQLVHLSSIENPKIQLIAANTHLHFDPLYEDVKYFQAALCVRYIDFIIKKIKSLRKNTQKIQIIFCGDFNFEPNSKPAKLLRNDINKEVNNSIQQNIKEEEKQKQFNFFLFINWLFWTFFGNIFGANWLPNNYLENKDIEKIEVPLKFQCATGFPPYTNFTRAEGYPKEAFIGCLDYIWVYPQVKTINVLPMPDHKLVIKYGAIPSRIAPSDHLPIICEICLNDNDNTNK
ncbi:Endo/exonuclease/phosphatase domain-containing protein [Meloidogyne graminicola]|uniref:Endo/exonuclease/phosphatase domain-containing protein n=1 Tax=Meloidogyne graminicola TaxID=189291 RepID=A0A8S9ZAI0_9BILA|nr:Endo/exonuclease/phosphatase domain-containing protein [Meloidogyne graminicola]